MTWLINLFIRQRVRDVVQNYIDCPSNWKFKQSTYELYNAKHSIAIEFHSNFTSIYRFNAGFPIDHKDTLSFIEKKYLCHKFKKLLRATQAKPIPTKATHPEEFL